MSMSKRNPLFRDNEALLDNVVGNLGEEMKEQQLSNVEGGTSIPCSVLMAEIVSEVSSICCAGAVTGASWMITNEVAK